MKSLNLKKIAAVGAGLALVAASVAGAVSWSELVNTTNHTMNVNGIVVGTQAQPEDMVAANMLANALATKAVYTTSVTTTTVEPVCTTAVGGALDDALSYRIHKPLATSALTDYNVTNSKLDSLVDESKDQKLNGVTKSVTMKETIVFTSEPSYDVDTDVQALTSEVDTGALEYSVALTGDALAVDTNFNDTSDDYIALPFLGNWYTLNKTNSSEIQLVKTSSPVTYNVGESINAVGKDGKTYKMTVTGGFVDSSNYITLSLYNEAGVLVDTQDFLSGDDVIFYQAGEEVLADSIYVDSVIKTTQASSDVFQARMRTGAGRIVLKDGACYPDYTETDKSKCDWEANVTLSTNLTAYGLKNTKSYKFVDTTALEAGDSVYFPENFAALKFVGLELPKYDATNAVDVTTVTIGNTVENNSDSSDRGLVFTDASDIKHNLPFYYELGSYSLPSGETEGMNFKFDGVSYYIGFKGNGATDMNYVVGEGTYNSSATYTYTNATYRSATANVVTLTGNDDRDYNYVLAFEAVANRYTAWLLLKGNQTFALQDSSSLIFRGTDYTPATEADATIALIDVNAYVPKQTKMENVVGTGLTSAVIDDDAEFFTATFDVVANSTVGSKVTRVYIDTQSDTLTDEDNTDNSLTWTMYANAAVDANWVATTGTALKLEADKLKEYISTTGVVSEVVDDEYAMVTIPKEVADGEFKVYGKAAIGGTETCVDTNVTKTVDQSVKYTGLPFVPMKDTEATTGKYIVVGGYMVNSLFPSQEQTATLLGAPLAADGDKVIALNAGNLYVAGYTKEDTQAAVSDLIASLETQ